MSGTLVTILTVGMIGVFAYGLSKKGGSTQLSDRGKKDKEVLIQGGEISYDYKDPKGTFSKAKEKFSKGGKKSDN